MCDGLGEMCMDPVWSASHGLGESAGMDRFLHRVLSLDWGRFRTGGEHCSSSFQLCHGLGEKAHFRLFYYKSSFRTGGDS